ncbi:hypothetical protein NFI96_009811 [Prochilodus magdalenae]|nr:hypothetical protein NFI96_009811 [Prochilodus magdalenae]
MLFIDFSAAFNTVIPSKLISKLDDLGISTTLCNWISDFLTDRPQSVKLDNLSSSFISLNTGVPQGCVSSPILYSLFTHDCVPIHGSNTIMKYADDTTVIGLIRDNDKMAYRDEVQHLSTWCHDNNLTLNTQKTKEIIMDLRRSRSQAHPPVYIRGAAVEQVTSFKFLGTHISSDLTWSLNSSVLVKNAQQRLYFLRSLKKVHLSPRILVNFYGCTIESILTNSILCMARYAQETPLTRTSRLRNCFFFIEDCSHQFTTSHNKTRLELIIRVPETGTPDTLTDFNI